MGIFGGLAASLLGVGGSLLGANMQANAAKGQASDMRQAAADQRGFDEDQALQVMVRQMRALYGSKAPAMLKKYLTTDQYKKVFGSPGTPAVPGAKKTTSAASSISPYLPGPPDMATGRRKPNPAYAVQQQIDASLDPGTPATPGTPGEFDWSGEEDPGFMGKFDDLIGKYTDEANGLVTSYDADTGTIRDMGDQNLAALTGFGDTRKHAVDRDMQRALKQSNAAIASKANTTGLGGSSLVGQMFGGNAKRLFESANDKKGSIDDQIMALSQTTRGDNLNRVAGRLGGRTSLKAGVLDQSQALRQQPLQAELGVLTGGAFAPFANRNTQAYFPGVSGSGLSQGAMGGVLSGVGSQAFGAGTSAMLRSLFSKQGSTGINNGLNSFQDEENPWAKAAAAMGF